MQHQNTHQTTLQRLAEKTLRACYADQGIVAGRGHFNQYWLRDACFASWGSIAIGDHQLIGRQLRLFTKSMREDGALPLRIGSEHILSALIRDRINRTHQTTSPNPTQYIFKDDKRQATTLDSNPLYIISATLDALTGTRRVPFPMLERAFTFSENHTRYGLLYQIPYGGWADSVKKRGFGIYMNTLYYAAARCLSILAPANKHATYAKKAEEIRDLITMRLWNGRYYNDFVNEHDRCEAFCVEGNLLAVLFGLTNQKQEQKILSYVDRKKRIVDEAGINVYPHYPTKHISARLRLVGMNSYHNGLRWLWIAGVIILASHAANDANAKERTQRTIQSIERLLHNAEWIGEVYYNGKPYENLFYRSEEPFAWSSGVLCAALSGGLDQAFAQIRSDRTSGGAYPPGP